MNRNATHNPGLEVGSKVLCRGNGLNNVPSVRFANWIYKNGSVEPSELMWSGLSSANLAAIGSQD